MDINMSEVRNLYVLEDAIGYGEERINPPFLPEKCWKFLASRE